jgi:serine/threonine-protein kinase RsbT
VAALTPIRLAIAADGDVGRARRAARALARDQGLGQAEAEAVALAVTELTTNLVRYAQDGEIVLSAVQGSRGGGVEVESRDAGPGISDLDRALRDGFSTGGGLGSGLPGAHRLMDEFEIITGPTGTRIVARKWPTAG